MKARLSVMAVAVLAMWALKRHYADARVEDLWWILQPIARLAGAATGTAFAMEPGAGYFSRERMFVIEKSCAGVNFMIAAFGMLMFALRRRITSALSGVRVLGVSLLASYLAAVLVNATRITIALWFTAQPSALARFSPAQIHRLEGIAVYFGGLVLLHELACRSAAIEERP